VLQSEPSNVPSKLEILPVLEEVEERNRGSHESPPAAVFGNEVVLVVVGMMETKLIEVDRKALRRD
jgi:hypothetical protein